jgi:hypothetical protein
MDDLMSRADGQTRALELQSLLLNLDNVVRRIDSLMDRTPDEVRARNTEDLICAVNDVHTLVSELFTCGRKHLVRLPRWLMPTMAGEDPVGSPGGLRLLAARLDSLDGDWFDVADNLGVEWHLLEAVTDFWHEVVTTERVGPETPHATDGTIAFWVPVIDKNRTNNGLLARLTLVPGRAEPGTAPRVSGGELLVTDKFRAGLQQGQAAALTLAERLGVSAEAAAPWARLDVTEVAGAGEGRRLDDTSAGGPLAVELLRRMMTLPPATTLVTGQVSAIGQLSCIEGDPLHAKAAAARDGGYNLATFDVDTHLIQVGQTLWGPEWLDARGRLSREWLKREGCAVRELALDMTAIPVLGGRSVIPVRLPLTDRIEKRLDLGVPAIVVGGGRGSSRSISSVQAVAGFAESSGRRALEITFAGGRLRSQSDLRETLRHAYVAFGVDTAVGAVVLLEDLLPHDEDSDIDAVLPAVAADMNARIVAVCLYTGGSRWPTDEVSTVPAIREHVASIHGFDEVADFVDRLCAANDLTVPESSRLGAVRHAAGGDLGMLTALLFTAASGEDRRPTVADVRRAWANELLRDVKDQSLSDLCTVAACSLVGVGVPDSLIADSADIRMLGGLMNGMDHWRLPASSSRAVLARLAPGSFADPEWAGKSDAKFRALDDFLTPRLQDYDPQVVNLITALLAGSKTIDQRLNRALVTRLATWLSTFVRDSARPVVIARVLLLGHLDHDPQLRATLLKALLVGVRDVGWARLRIIEASTVLSALRAHRDEVVRAKETESLYSEVMSTAAEGLRVVLGSASPFPGALLIHELGRFHEAETNQGIAQLVQIAARRCDETSFTDYEAAISLIEAVTRYHTDSDRSTILRRLESNPGIARLLAHDGHKQVGLILAQVAVRLAIQPTQTEDDSVAMRRCAVAVRFALSPASRVRLHDGLTLLARVDKRFARGVVRWIDGFTPWLREQFTIALPWESSAILRLLAYLRVDTAVDLLYPGGAADGELEHDSAVVESLADRVIAVGDLKGAGHIVAAIANVDANWGPGGPAAASYAICERLEAFIREALAHEYRATVVLATMSALVDAGCPVPALRRLLECCAETVEREIRNTEKEHGPRLGHLLATHEEIGPELAALILARVPTTLIVSRLRNVPGTAARTAYHRLVRSLGLTRDADVVEALADQETIEQHLRLLEKSPVIIALEGVRAYQKTLIEIGYPIPGADMLAEIDGSLSGWARRLRRLHHPSQRATALDLLRRISPAFATACLDELEGRSRLGSARIGRDRLWVDENTTGHVDEVLPAAGKPTPIRLAVLAKRGVRGLDEPRRVEGLVRYAGRGFIHPVPAIDFITAVDRVDPGRGQQIGRALSAKSSWPHRLRLIADTDNPVQFGTLLRSMAAVDLLVSDDFLHRIEQIWMPVASHIRSPRAASALLTGFAASGLAGKELARRLADSLDIEQIGRRFRSGGPTGDEFLPSLVRALRVWGAEDAATRLTATIGPDSYGSGNPSRSDNLLRCIHEVTGQVPASHLEAAAAGLAEAIAARAAIGNQQFWHAAGLLCRTLRRCGGADLVPLGALIPVIGSGALAPGLALWAATSAVGGPAAESIAAVSVGDILGDIASAPDALTSTAFVLSVVELGPDREDAIRDLDVMEPFVHLSTRWQLELITAAATSPVLTRRVHAERGWLTEYGEWMLDVGFPAGAALLHSLGEVVLT